MIDYRNGVSIAEVVVYVPALFVAIYLAFTHGAGRSSGWIFLIIFCLARIIGPCMQLATISMPRNVSLYTGSSILNNIGLSPLEMAALGLLSRLVTSIAKTHRTPLGPRILRLVQLVTTVGLILGIVGGIDASTAFAKTGIYHPVAKNKAGTALLILAYVLLVAFTAITYPFVTYAEAGEKRLFLAIALSLPFLLVRVVYSCFSTYSTDSQFNLVRGNVTILLCVALIEEFCVVVIYEATGLTLQKATREPHIEAATAPRSIDSDTPIQAQKQKLGGDSAAVGILKKTMIGRLVTAAVSSEK